MKINERSILQHVLDYILLVVGGIILGIAIEYVLLPVKLTTGGFSGLATLMYYFMKIPVEISIILLNLPTFVITWRVLGKRFGIRSFVGMLACSLGAVIGRNFGILTMDMLLAAIYGGALCGVGIALTYKAGGSTGGTDIIAKLISKKFEHVNVGEALLIVDGIIITVLALTFKNIEIGLYSVVSAFIMSKIIDLMLLGADYAKAVFVITGKANDISKYIHIEIGRTTTKFKVTGTYSAEEKEMLLCVVNKKEIPSLKAAINEIDPESFTIVTAVTEAIGEGFKNQVV